MLCVTKRGLQLFCRLALVLGAGLACALPVQARPAAKPAYKLAPIATVHSNPVLGSILTAEGRPLNLSQPDALTATTGIDSGRDDLSLGLGSGFFVPAYFSTAGDDAHLIQSVQPVRGQGLAQWRTEEIRLGDRGRGTAVNALRLSVLALERVPGGLVLGPNLGPDLGTNQGQGVGETRSFDVSYIRGWPSALMLKAGAYDLDLTPHAGFGLSDQGGSAEAGAMVRFGAGLNDARARQIAEGFGLSTVDSQSFGDRGRWYLFASASGRAVGLNLTRDGTTGNLRGLGWSIDPAARIISDAQAGFGWRQGPVQASFGYLHRDIKNAFEVRGTGRGGDSLIALSFSIRPQH
jgi:hypothetical protein